MSLFTLGHSTLTPDQFLKAARSLDIIIDTRSHPGSTKYPHFNKEEMERWLPEAGIDYTWAPQLGGWRSEHASDPDLLARMAAVGVDILPYARRGFPKHRIGVDRPRADIETAESTGRPTWSNQGLHDYAWFAAQPEFLDAIRLLELLYAQPADPAAAVICCEACVPGDSLVKAAGLQRVFRRHYHGPLLTIEIASDDRLSVTPNHPILTPQGWVPAHRLRQGDSVVGSLGLEGFTPIGAYPDIEHRPVPIAQIFDALQGPPSRIVGRVVDFHGEPVDDEIDVVTADCALRAIIDTECFQIPTKLALPELAPNGLTGLPRLRQVAVQPLISLYMDTSVARSGQSCGRRYFPPSQPRSITLGSRRHTREPQIFDHSGPTEAELLAQGQYRFTGHEPVYKILSIGVRQFEGHVYDLETTPGCYVAQGVTLRNCWWRCHRSMIADALHFRGVPCYHLPTKPPVRPTTPRWKAHADVIGNRIERYPEPVLDAWRKALPRGLEYGLHR